MKRIATHHQSFFIYIVLLGLINLSACAGFHQSGTKNKVRQRISINEGWKFFKYLSAEEADNLIYDVRPEVEERNLVKDADSKPTEAVKVLSGEETLKAWIMPSGNDFIKDPAKKFIRPAEEPNVDFEFLNSDFDDSSWESVTLPHDWAIKGPFQEGWDSEVGGGMGRLPSNGVAWYRRKLDIPATDKRKSIFLDIDGAMSYSIVWLNGHLVGGWPYGYNSFRLDLTPYIVPGGENQLAIRLDNPNYSARWYPGGGIYRNVWLVKTNPVRVAQYGVRVQTSDISEESAFIQINTIVENKSSEDKTIRVFNEIFELDESGNANGKGISIVDSFELKIKSGEKRGVSGGKSIQHPRLWGPHPSQVPNMYVAVTTLKQNNEVIDVYKTPFGIRSLEFNPDSGIIVNGELIKIQGVNEHHDLGALGAAFNNRAAERKLEILREMGCNAIRMAHNPPAPEFLDLCDKMGFLVMDEIFDSWERKKTPHDFHLIFPDWFEQDLRNMVRRDRNHPSIVIWSFGNEVGEQYTDTAGAAIALRLHDIVKEEDSSRPTTSAMNWAKSYMPFPEVMDLISFNYQGEGIRQDPIFDEVKDRIKTKPQYVPYHKKFPDKVILSSETASAFSSRGIYYFPVTDKISSPARDGKGGNSEEAQVSAYELYAVDFGSSADKVFRSLDHHPYSAGEFVWTGFDYLGEPTPYYQCRSSYNGILDLAGFPKDRYFLYQSRWRPDLPMAHILPHWNWPERVGEITPVHVFTSGDEAELFLNGESLGRIKKGEYEYRLRWDEVKYQPGELKVVAYKNGEKWAEDVVKTTDKPAKIELVADRKSINSDGKDLVYITLRILDKDGLFVANATNKISFSIDGPGEIVATDNGDPSDMDEFPLPERKAFSGMALVIVKAEKGKKGTFVVTAKSDGLGDTDIKIASE